MKLANSSNRRLRAAVNADRENWDYVFPDRIASEFRKRLDFESDVLPDAPDPTELAQRASGAEIILSTWGAAPITAQVLEGCPELKLVLHAAGSVKPFATHELAERKVPVVSAVEVNARPVAEYCLGIILTSLKNVFEYHNDFLSRGRDAWQRYLSGFEGGYYRSKVGLVGFGAITRELLELLRPFDMEVYVVSSHFGTVEEEQYGAQAASLETVVESCDVISLHGADIPRNWNTLNRQNLRKLRSRARIINTARGRLIDEEALAELLAQRPDVTAYLDVTYPEPPIAESPLYAQQNCILTPHVAGSIGSEVQRMSLFCLEQLDRWSQGAELQGVVDLATLGEKA